MTSKCMFPGIMVVLQSWLFMAALVIYVHILLYIYVHILLYICKYIALKEKYSGKSKGTAGGG